MNGIGSNGSLATTRPSKLKESSFYFSSKRKLEFFRLHRIEHAE